MNPLLKLAAAFSPPEIDPATIAVYAEKLRDENPEHVAWACERAIETCKHLPRVSELLTLISKRKIQLADEKRITDQKRLLSEPTTKPPPNLMEMLRRERSKAERENSKPRRLMDFG